MMRPTLSFMTFRSVPICFSTFVLCACFLWTCSTLAVCPKQDKAAAVQEKAELTDPQEIDDALEAAGAIEVEDAENQQAPMWANMGLSPKKMQAAKRFRLTQTFQVEVEELTRILELESKQQKKLSIAAKGATQKLLAQWSKKRGLNLNAAAEKEAETDDEEVEITDADQIDEQTLMMMDMDGGNPFGGERPLQNPFWKKTLAKILTTEQLAALKTFRAEQAKVKKVAQIATMMQILNTDLGLSPTQSEELQQLITPHIDSAKPVSMPLYDMFLTLYYASKVDEGDLQKLLSSAQHQKWKLLMVPMRQIGTMLEQQAQAEEPMLPPVAVEEAVEE